MNEKRNRITLRLSDKILRKCEEGMIVTDAIDKKLVQKLLEKKAEQRQNF